MIGLDSTFIIDFLSGDEKAVFKAKEFEGTHILTTSVNVFEVLLGAFLSKKNSGTQLAAAKALFARTEVLEITDSTAETAARMEADLIMRGREVNVTDILIAAAYLSRGCTKIITRDKDFERIREIEVEKY